MPHQSIELSPPRSATLLAAYFDLADNSGPLHARSTADMGRTLLTGRPIPAYQSMTAPQFRRLLELDAPGYPSIDDPRSLPQQERSPEWQYLCEQIDAWDRLNVEQQLRTARVLFKLGFWNTIVALPVTEPTSSPTDDGWRLLRIWHSATVKAGGHIDPVVQPEMYAIAVKLAEDGDAPPAKRLSAAVNLLVHHARHDQSTGLVYHWSQVGHALVQTAASGTLSPLLVSAYWRAASFAPFFDNDHEEVRTMLDEAERIARHALAQEDADHHLLALENLRLVFMTRARAAAGAQDSQSAENYYRLLVDLDPLDSHARTLLADFLAADDRIDEARAAYAEAASLGAPYTRHAITRFLELSCR